MIYPDVTAVESELLSRLAADPVLGGWSPEITAVAGLTERDQVGKLFAKMPAVGTWCPSGRFEGDQFSQLETCPIYVICAGVNYRNPAAARRGDTEHPGAHHLAECARRVITAWGQEGNLKNIRPLSWRLAWSNPQIAVVVLEARVELARPLTPTQEETQSYGSDYPA